MAYRYSTSAVPEYLPLFDIPNLISRYERDCDRLPTKQSESESVGSSATFPQDTVTANARNRQALHPAVFGNLSIQ
jgi:hypothetical protein